jgi:hypothetical protein
LVGIGSLSNSRADHGCESGPKENRPLSIFTRQCAVEWSTSVYPFHDYPVHPTTRRL